MMKLVSKIFLIQVDEEVIVEQMEFDECMVMKQYCSHHRYLHISKMEMRDVEFHHNSRRDDEDCLRKMNLKKLHVVVVVLVIDE